MTVNEFLPFFSIRHGPHGDDDGCFWYAQRKPSLRRDADGSEMSITLVYRDMNPRVPSLDTLSIGLTCKIARASCWERVCKSVKISVVAEPLKKNTIHTQ